MYLDEMVHTCILLDEMELDVKKLDEVGINLSHVCKNTLVKQNSVLLPQ